MPTYEYACKQCGEHLEVVQSFTDDNLTVCPNCAGELRKVFGSIGIVFKGSGFYKNDSRTTSRSEKGSDAVAAKSESSNGDSGSTTAPAQSDKADKSDKSDKPDKSDKSAKTDSSPKAGKSEPKTASSTSEPKKPAAAAAAS